MEKKKRAQSNATRILTLLNEKGPTRFNDICEILKSSPSAISYALNRKLLPQLVERLPGRKYNITSSGKAILEINQLNRFMENEENPTYDEEFQFASLIEHPAPFLEARNAVPVKIALLGPPDLGSKGLDSIKRELGYFPGLLIDRFAEVVGNYRGLNQKPELGSNSPHYDNLRWMKDAYDFEATLIIDVNPRSLIRSLDWDQIISESRKKDEIFFLGLQEVKRQIQKNREKLISEFLRRELAYKVERTADYLGRASNESIDALLGFSESEVKERLSRILDNMINSLNINMSRIERDSLLSHIQRESFRISSKTIFVIEKIKNNSPKKTQ
jgi:hypothetical protein